VADRDLPVEPLDGFAPDVDLAARLRASYGALPPADPVQVERVTRAVLASAMHASSRRDGSPRPRWWWGAAAAALLVVVVMRPWRPGLSHAEAHRAFPVPSASDGPVGATREERGGAVRFDLVLPSPAAEVSLVGDFNGWDDEATPMVRRASDGTWSARVPLPPGRHVYAFVVDGKQWLIDPLAPQVPDAGFGPTNALIVEGPR
jgi:hypothetical protein